MPAWKEGIQSIYTFIRRTAENHKTGICWETIDYDNNPQRNYNLFNGVAGIPLFLIDYYRFKGDKEALRLAEGAIKWCQSSESVTSNDQMDHQRGLQTGRVGIAYVHMLLDTLLKAQPSPYCHEIANHLLNEPCGPVTDFMGGEASNGFYLLKLYQQSQDSRYLDGAKRCANWIIEKLVRENDGVFCQMFPADEENKGRYFLGVSHGISGVAYFFCLLYDETLDQHYKRIANDLLDTVVDQAIESHTGLNWPVIAGAKELLRCQYSHGAAGIGMVLARASGLLNRPDLLQTALKAGEASYHYGDFRNNLTLCTGVTGSGHLMLDLYTKTRDSHWLERAKEFASMADSYKEITPEGDAWPTDEPGLYSADYVYGAAGVGHFFLRISDPDKYSMPLF